MNARPMSKLLYGHAGPVCCPASGRSNLAALLSSCSTADIDHFWGLDAQPGYTGPSDYYGNGRPPTPYQPRAADPWFAQQNAAREANMQALRE